jgi:hypothetical protein
MRWNVYANNVNCPNDELEAFLNSNYTFNPPTAIPAELLSVGVVYNFNVQLCNNFLQCAANSAVVRMVNDTLSSAAQLPVLVRRFSPSFVSDPTGASTELMGGVVSPDGAQCTGIVAAAAPRSIPADNITWVAYDLQYGDNRTLVTRIASQSKVPWKFKVDPYTLELASTYELVLLVASGHELFYSYPAYVHIDPGSIQAVLNTTAGFDGGNTSGSGSVISLVRRSSVTISGQNSVDENVSENARGTNFVFEWSCFQFRPHFDASCPVLEELELQQQNNSSLPVFENRLTLFANEDERHVPVGAVYRVMLTITD